MTRCSATISRRVREFTQRRVVIITFRSNRVWGDLKGGELANLCLDTIDEAEEIVDQGLCRIGNDTRLAFSFLRHCGLEL